MRAEIEFTVDVEGSPIIQIRHHDKSSAMEQRLLGVFINKARANGLKIVSPGGYISSEGESWENYIIKPNENKV